MSDIKKVKTRKIHKVEEDKSLNQVKFADEKKTNNRANKVRKRKIRMDLTRAEEKEINDATSRADNLFMFGLIFILIVCFVLGILFGRLLYGIAMNSLL